MTSRGRKRPRQKVRHLRVRRSTKRVLREQANVEDCFDACSDRGFHCDPDINIGSEADPSREHPSTPSEGQKDAHLITGNQFSTLDSGWSSATSQAITPLQSSFNFASANPCSLSVQNSLNSLLPSIPSTPPSHRPLKFPDKVSNNGVPEVRPRPGLLYTSNSDTFNPPHTRFGLPPIPSPFLYHNESRELLLGIDGSDHSLTKTFAIDYGQEAPKPDFKSYRVDFTPCDGDGRQVHAEGGLKPLLDNEPIFAGAAVPDMSKALNKRPITIELPDTDFHKRTRSYVPPDNNSTKEWTYASVSTRSNAVSTTDQNKETHPPILTITNTFPRCLLTMKDVFPGPYSRETPLTPPSKASRQTDASLDKPGLSESMTSPLVQQQTDVHGFIFPKLTPAAVCRKIPSPRCQNTDDGYVRRMTNFWESGGGNHPRKAYLRARTVPSKVNNEVKASDVDSAMSAFEQAMSKMPPDPVGATKSMGFWIQPHSLQGAGSSWCSQTRMPVPLSHSALHSFRQSPIRHAAIHSVISPSTLFEPNNNNDVAAGPSSACTALVPSTLYKHQYLGWPSCRTGEEIVYQDETWPSLGAYIAHLQRELASEGPETEVGTKEDANQNARTKNAVECAEGHLDMEMDCSEDHHCTNAWLQALAGQSGCMDVASDYNLHDLFEERTKSEGTRDPAKESFAHCIVPNDDIALSFFDKFVDSPDSGVSWSEIGTDDEDEEDWDWSEDELGAGRGKV